ncbi:hypothetical protein TNCV_3277771 [Trichonephila clavipes]|nr:hypothetical protein TNCV_3277771 [Trichonephila clavipes]
MLVGLLSRWCFLIGGHGRRQWAGRTGDFGGLRKNQVQIQCKQTRSSSAIGRQESVSENSIHCAWCREYACWWAEQMAAVRKEILSSSTLGFRMPEKSEK